MFPQIAEGSSHLSVWKDAFGLRHPFPQPVPYSYLCEHIQRQMLWNRKSITEQIIPWIFSVMVASNAYWQEQWLLRDEVFLLSPSAEISCPLTRGIWATETPQIFLFNAFLDFVMISFSLQAETGFWKQRGKDQVACSSLQQRSSRSPRKCWGRGLDRTATLSPILLIFYLQLTLIQESTQRTGSSSGTPSNLGRWFLCRWAQMLFLSALKSHPLSRAPELPCPLSPCSTSLGLSDSRKPQESVWCTFEQHPSCTGHEKRQKSLPVLHLSDEFSLSCMKTGLWTDDSGCWAPDKASSTLSFRIASRSCSCALTSWQWACCYLLP